MTSEHDNQNIEAAELAMRAEEKMNMTPQETIEAGKLMIAWAEARLRGEEFPLEYFGRCKTRWLDTGHPTWDWQTFAYRPTWDWQTFAYRRKPEPKWRPATYGDIGKRCRWWSVTEINVKGVLIYVNEGYAWVENENKSNPPTTVDLSLVEVLDEVES